MFIHSITTKPEKKTDDGNTIRMVLPFKDQIASNTVRTQLRDLSNKIAITLQPIFVRKHFLEAQGDKNRLNEGQFLALKKCHGKVDCLVYEMLFIKELKPSLNGSEWLHQC